MKKSLLIKKFLKQKLKNKNIKVQKKSLMYTIHIYQPESILKNLKFKTLYELQNYILALLKEKLKININFITIIFDDEQK